MLDKKQLFSTFWQQTIAAIGIEQSSRAEQTLAWH